MIKQTLNPKNMHFEYGIMLQRFYPTPKVKHFLPFGSSWGIVEKGQSTMSHSHHELETFYITNGSGKMQIDDEICEVSVGDVIFIPPFSTHTLSNEIEDVLTFISIWWELPENEVEK